jgi:hypothetical protein
MLTSVWLLQLATMTAGVGVEGAVSRPPKCRNLAVTGRHVLGTGCQHTGARLALDEAAWHSMADTHMPDTCSPGITCLIQQSSPNGKHPLCFLITPLIYIYHTDNMTGAVSSGVAEACMLAEVVRGVGRGRMRQAGGRG